MLYNRKRRQVEYLAYLQSQSWAELRERVRQRVRMRFSGYLACERCGCLGRGCCGKFHVHHLRYPKNFGTEPPEWLLHVCQKCHAELHPGWNMKPTPGDDLDDILRKINSL